MKRTTPRRHGRYQAEDVFPLRSCTMSVLVGRTAITGTLPHLGSGMDHIGRITILLYKKITYPKMLYSWYYFSIITRLEMTRTRLILILLIESIDIKEKNLYYLVHSQHDYELTWVMDNRHSRRRTTRMSSSAYISSCVPTKPVNCVSQTHRRHLKRHQNLTEVPLQPLYESPSVPTKPVELCHDTLL
jgi:hypothetical protein